MFLKFRISIQQKITLGFFLLAIVSMLGAFTHHLSFPDSSYNFLGESKKVKMDDGKYITQSFVAKEDNLNQIKILLGNTNLWPGEKILLTLAEPDCHTVLRESTLSFLSLQPHVYSRFDFPVLPRSKNQEYCLKISYSSPYDKGDNRPYIAAAMGSIFSHTSYTDTKNKVLVGRTLQIRPSYGTGSFREDIAQLNNRLSQYKPFFAKGVFIVNFFILTLLGSILLVCWMIFSKDPQ